MFWTRDVAPRRTAFIPPSPSSLSASVQYKNLPPNHQGFQYRIDTINYRSKPEVYQNLEFTSPP